MMLIAASREECRPTMNFTLKTLGKQDLSTETNCSDSAPLNLPIFWVWLRLLTDLLANTVQKRPFWGYDAVVTISPEMKEQVRKC